MICYRDMTFCPFWEQCANGVGCHSALTPKVKEGARKWWEAVSDSPPIAQYTDKPNCFEEKNGKD